MKILQIPLVLGLIVGFNPALVYAQTPGETTAQALTREQIKKERDEFIKTHRYDSETDNWVLRKEYEPPASMKTRAQVKAERDEFIKTHKYDYATDSWVPLNGEPKGTQTRAQVRAEAAQFLRTHTWNDIESSWVENKGVRKVPGR